MENTVIRKRLNSYKSEGGRLSKVDDEVVLDVLRAWESWQRTATFSPPPKQLRCVISELFCMSLKLSF